MPPKLATKRARRNAAKVAQAVRARRSDRIRSAQQNRDLRDITKATSELRVASNGKSSKRNARKRKATRKKSPAKPVAQPSSGGESSSAEQMEVDDDDGEEESEENFASGVTLDQKNIQSAINALKRVSPSLLRSGIQAPSPYNNVKAVQETVKRLETLAGNPKAFSTLKDFAQFLKLTKIMSLCKLIYRLLNGEKVEVILTRRSNQSQSQRQQQEFVPEKPSHINQFNMMAAGVSSKVQRVQVTDMAPCATSEWVQAVLYLVIEFEMKVSFILERATHEEPGVDTSPINRVIAAAKRGKVGLKMYTSDGNVFEHRTQKGMDLVQEEMQKTYQLSADRSYASSQNAKDNQSRNKTARIRTAINTPYDDRSDAQHQLAQVWLESSGIHFLYEAVRFANEEEIAGHPDLMQAYAQEGIVSQLVLVMDPGKRYPNEMTTLKEIQDQHL